MSYANADSSRKERKSIMLGGLYSLAVEFDKEVTIIPNSKNKPYIFSEENGLSEITAYNNSLKKENGKIKRINKKTGRPYVCREIPKGLEKHAVKDRD